MDEEPQEEVEASEVQVEAAQVEAAQVEAAQVEAAQVEGAQVEKDGPVMSRLLFWTIVGPIIVLAAVGTITTALTPALAARHPLLLITLEARNRNLILAREVDFVPFILIATFRRLLTDPLYYALGWFYGERAVRWLEVKAGLGSYARMMERIFQKASWPAVFFFPGSVVCALAGVVRMRFTTFLALNVAGTLAAVIALKAFGDVVATPVEAVVGFFDRHLVATTLVSVALVLLSIWAGRMQGELSIKDIEDFDEEEAERPSE